MQSQRKEPCLDLATTRSQSSAEIRAFNLKPIERFNTSQLPNRADVLRRYFGIQDEFKNCKPKREVAAIIFEELKEIWAQGPYPVLTKNNAQNKIVKLHDDWRKMARNFTKTKGSTNDKFQNELLRIFDIAAKDSEKIIGTDRFRTVAQRSEDLSFLIDQRTKRKARFSSRDPQYEKKIKKNLIKEPTYLKQKNEREISNVDDLDKLSITDDENQECCLSNDDDDLASDDNYTPNYYYNRLEINEEETRENPSPSSFTEVVRSTKLLSTFDRTNASLRERVQIVAATAGALNIDISKHSISKSTMHRNSKNSRKKIAEKIKSSFFAT